MPAPYVTTTSPSTSAALSRELGRLRSRFFVLEAAQREALDALGETIVDLDARIRDIDGRE